MEKLYRLSVFSLLMFAIISPIWVSGQSPVAHGDGIGIIVVKQKICMNHHTCQYVPMPDEVAAGFATDECDFVTTSSILSSYERVQTWKVSKEKMTIREKDIVQRILEVTIGGKTYRGELRPVGLFPLSLNLACVDVDDSFKENPEIHHLRIEGYSTIVDPTVPPGAMQGTPVFGEHGNVVSMIAQNNLDLSIGISGAEIVHFLDEVKKVPRSRPLLLKP